MEDLGIVGVGGPLTVERLKLAYSQGIFPWPHEGHLLWFCPPERGVLFFKNFKVNERLKRYYKNSGLRFSQNENFEEVIEECSRAPRRGQKGTWLTPEMKKAYKALHKAGLAYSFEAWEGEKLVGGLYGVLIKNVFSGESVFGHKNNVTKFCVIECVQYLKSLKHNWMDIQMVTPLTESFGGEYVDRPVFFELLKLRQRETISL